jgi:nuclear pore complex protein Nup188
LDESASIGTLLELGNCTLDVLRDLVNRPAGQTIVPPPSYTYERPLDVKQGVITARWNLEAVCLYAITQLGMWVSKPEFDGGDIEVDEPADNQSLRSDSKERRRTSSTIAERLRRGMTGEMNTDLQGLLLKAKPVITKSESLISSSSGGVDLTQVLFNFLHDRIGAPS